MRASSKAVESTRDKKIIESFGCESSFIRRWQSAIELEELRRKTILRLASSPLLGPKNAGHNNSPIVQPKSALRVYHSSENRILVLNCTPWNGSEYGVEKSTCRISSTSRESGGRNTFGTYHKLRPIYRHSFDVSTESLPPPPSPKTLRRVMSIL